MDPVDLAFQLRIDGVWTTYQCYAESGWEVKIGPDAENSVRPNSISIVLANDDLALDPENAASPLYGRIGLNTQARLRIDGTTTTWAEASSWVPERTSEHVAGAGRGRAEIVVGAEGVLRRLQQWEDPIESALTRQTLSYGDDLIGYWPLEDASGAGQLSQKATRGGAGSYSGKVDLGNVDGPPGSSPIARVGTGATLSGTFARTSQADSYQLSFVCQLEQAPTSTAFLPMFGWRDTLGRTWWWNVSSTNFKVESVANGSGSGTMSIDVAHGSGVDVTKPTRFRVKMTPIISGDTTVEIAWYQADGSVVYGTSAVLTDHSGQPTTWFVNQNAWNDGAGIGHIFAVTDTTLDLTSGYNAVRAFNGYLQERAAARWKRLCEENGITCWINGDIELTPPMGRQKAGPLLELLEECTTTAAGIMYDEPQDTALRLRTYDYLINRTPALQLDRTDLLNGTLRRATTGTGRVNDVTLQNADGSTARAELASGPNSILPPPAGVGRYKGGSDLKLNYADGWRLEQRAVWELNKGTVQRPRYPRVTLDLMTRPDLRPAVAAMRPGDWITLAGEEPDTVTLRVIGIERSGGAKTDRVTFLCLPAEPYMVAVADQSRIGSSSTTVASATSSTATTLPIKTPYWVERWTTRAASFPHDVMVAGERMTVTAASAAVWSGTAWTQNLTVTRSVNGIVKAQAAGGTVDVAEHSTIGLG